MSIHREALALFGLDARVAKLREEALELALACDRYLSNREKINAVIAEACDVQIVSDSVRLADEELWRAFLGASYDKLEKAVYG